MGSWVARRLAVVVLAVTAICVPAVAWADTSADVAVEAPATATIGAGEPLDWEPTLSQCGLASCSPTNPTPPTIHFTTTLPAGVTMVHAGFPGNPGMLDNCLSNCSYTFPIDVERQYAYTLLATAPGTYELSIAIVSSNESDPDKSNNTSTTSLTVKPLVIKLKSSAVTGPHAGRPFGWSVEPISLITDHDIKPSSASCLAAIGTKRLTGKPTAALGKLTCSWKIPATARGKRLTATIAARLATASTTVTHAFKIAG